MILTIVRATANVGERSELQQAVEAVCRSAGDCLGYDLYPHPSDDDSLTCISKWRERGSHARADVVHEIRTALNGPLMPLCDRVEIELHSVSRTARSGSGATTLARNIASGSSETPTAVEPPNATNGEAGVRVVETYIRAHLHEDLAVADLAAVAGVSTRSLFRNFNRHRRRSPMKVLEEARLARARHGLLHGRKEDTVSRIASDSGFSHLGRFSQLYKRHYGESPSGTLRRSRQRQGDRPSANRFREQVPAPPLFVSHSRRPSNASSPAPPLEWARP